MAAWKVVRCAARVGVGPSALWMWWGPWRVQLVGRRHASGTLVVGPVAVVGVVVVRRSLLLA